MEKRPIGREKTVVQGTGSIKKQGVGAGTGPLGNRNGNTGLSKGGSKEREGSDKNGGGHSPKFSTLLSVLLVLVLVFCCVSTASAFSSETRKSILGDFISSMTSHEGFLWQDYSSNYQTDDWDDNTGVADTTTETAKKTEILSGGKDVVTVMVYMCGSDLESESGCGTADIQEMLAATTGDKVNLILMTGGSRQWCNNVVSNKYNQIYQIKGGEMYQLRDNFGTNSMTQGRTLSEFIDFCAKYFPANRNMLILWDHGGGSLSGFGYDEKYASSGSMILPEIADSIEQTGVLFDFIGFDACLMGTLETGLALAPYADYLIASEESESASGWYYTNWLTKLGKNTSMDTVSIGKLIADDFVQFTDRYYQGSSSTLAVTDLGELISVVPSKLKAFGSNISQLIAGASFSNGSYSNVSKARSKAREFGTSSRIDQVDLVDFAKRLNTQESKDLADAVLGSIKYNKVSRDMSGSYGLSVYFPYSNTKYVKMVNDVYESIGMVEEYTECIQEFASVEMSGQTVSGGGSPFDSLFGLFGSDDADSYYSYDTDSFGGLDFFGTTDTYDYGNDNYSNDYSYDSTGDYNYSYDTGDSTSDLLDGLFDAFLGGGLFGDRSLPEGLAENTAEYLSGNVFDQRNLEWKINEVGQSVIAMEDSQWQLLDHILLNMYYDDGEGLIDLGTDNVYDFDENGNLLGENDKTWLSIDGNIIAYYYESTFNGSDGYLIKGYSPVFYRGKAAKLLLAFDSEHPKGYISGIQYDYQSGEQETETVAKPLYGLPVGEELQFYADYYDYDGNYLESYQIGSWTITEEPVIANMTVGDGSVLAMYSLTDIYNQTYWTAPIN